MSENRTMAPVPADHPLMIAWEKYRASSAYQNTRKWALQEAHVDGSLWASFDMGFLAASIVPHPVAPGGPGVNPEGERLYQAACERSASEFPEEHNPEALEDAIRFIERWMPDSLPANDQGQVPFGRALLEMALSAMKSAVASKADAGGAS